MNKTRRSVTQEEINFIIQNDDKMTIKELSNKLNRSTGTVNKVRNKLGLKKDDKSPWSEEEKNILKNNNRLSNKDLAKLLKRTTSSVGSMRNYLDERVLRTCILCGSDFTDQASSTKTCNNCYTPRVIKLNKKDKDVNNPLIRYSHYKSGAKKRNIDFNLTEQEFYSFWKKSCTYCGDEIETIGLDRINSGKGYSMDNIVPCCSTCNWMKIDKPTDEWLSHIKKILTHMEKNNGS